MCSVWGIVVRSDTPRPWRQGLVIARLCCQVGSIWDGISWWGPLQSPPASEQQQSGHRRPHETGLSCSASFLLRKSQRIGTALDLENIKSIKDRWNEYWYWNGPLYNIISLTIVKWGIESIITGISCKHLTAAKIFPAFIHQLLYNYLILIYKS